MAKAKDKLSWFKFTPSDWVMGKIRKCPENTQARFMMLICLYWNKKCVLTEDDAEIEIDKKHLDLLKSKKVIKVLNGFIVIDFLDEQKSDVSETSVKRREAANERWQKNANGMQTDANALQSDAEKRREEKIREEEISTDVDKSDFDNSKNIAFGKNLKESPQWIENTAIQLKIKPEQVPKRIDAFVLHLGNTFKNQPNKKEFASHFINWSPKAPDSNKSPTKTLHI